MDPTIKIYADSLYEQIQLEALQKLQSDKTAYLQRRAARNTGVIPLSGPDMQEMIRLHSEYIERCMAGRIESYETAYGAVAVNPTPDEFKVIIEEAKGIRQAKIKQATNAIRQFVASHGGGVPFLPDESNLEHGTAHGHDQTLQKWKTWKAKAELASIKVKAEEPKKQLDALMPIYNRAEFNHDFNETTANSSNLKPYSLLFMDLDKFKAINDGAGGHAAGDQALIEFGKAVLAVTRGKGDAYRFGGDEICVILRNHTVAEATAVAERIRLEVQAIKSSNFPKGLSSSIGVAGFPETCKDPSKLCSVADSAMYVSKKAGGNCVSIASSEDVG